MEESFVEFDQSIIVDNEIRENFKKTQLVQGCNLFGKCTQPDCAKKSCVKLGYGSFQIGKKLVDQNKSDIMYERKEQVEIDEMSELFN